MMSRFKYICVTDCFLENEQGELLLIHRSKDQEILPDYCNGVGGKLEEFETPFEAIEREVKEETGSTEFSDLSLKGLLTVKDKFGFWQIFIFKGKIKRASVDETEESEGKLEWIPKERLKEKKLVPDLFAWVDLLWKERNFFFAKIEYDENYNLKKEVALKIIP